MFDKKQDAFVELCKTFKEHTTPIFLWIGAGMSVNAGFPTWKQLRDKMVEFAQKFLATVEEEHGRKLSVKLEMAKVEEDYWKSFQYIYEVVGDVEYSSYINKLFDKQVDIPLAYQKLFSLESNGIITTNIDKLVNQAFLMSEGRRKSPLIEFCGNECEDFCSCLSQNKFVIFHLHGCLEKRSSWVLREEEFKNLKGQKSYKKLLQSLFLEKTVVFIGCNPTDQAITVHLEEARERTWKNTPLYWITDRKDKEAVEFADRYKIRRIVYSPENSHQELIEVINGIGQSAPSRDESIDRPLINVPEFKRTIRNFDEQTLKNATYDERRQLLNKKALQILAPNTRDCYSSYQQFLKEFGRFVHAAWYVEVGETVLGLKIEEEIGDGAFGRVFRATTGEGETVAVKLLKEDVMRKPEYLQSFRRGVRAMKILGDAKLPGVVNYRFSTEIPTMVVMEYVDGVDLQTIVEQNQLTSWSDKIKILEGVGRIIKSAHALPERVLHRDIRPQNIMLRGFDYETPDWDVCVLDFDLAFHKGANEVSLRIDSGMNGYLSPEQIDVRSRITRNSRVDSYGFAMVCFFVLTRCEPKPQQCTQINWEKTIKENVLSQRCESWESAPFRMSEIIRQCTEADQARRMDLYQIHEYLNLISLAIKNPDLVREPRLVLDEVAVLFARRFESLSCLKIDRAGRLGFSRHGTEFSFYIDEGPCNIVSRIEWHNSGDREYRSTMKMLKERATALVDKVQRLNAEAHCRNEGQGEIVEIIFPLAKYSHGQLVAVAELCSKYPLCPN